MGLLHRIRRAAKYRHALTLPADVYRIQGGAKSSHFRMEPHTDMVSDRFRTTLGFLNPVWSSGDGGEFYLEDHKINYMPDRLILFRSTIPHDCGYVANPHLQRWRIAANIIRGRVN